MWVSIMIKFVNKFKRIEFRTNFDVGLDWESGYVENVG